MKRLFHFFVLVAVGWMISGCASRPKSVLGAENSAGHQMAIQRIDPPSPELKDKVLALDPVHVEEQDGLRPMTVGHSLGGIQAIRVLCRLAGNPVEQAQIWTPVTETSEDRFEIVDPLTGTKHPLAGLQLPYARVALSGGIARIIPGEWDMSDKLREIPDSVEEFTGFQKGFDMAGGGFMGYGDGNDYHPTGSARVWNVRLPWFSAHWTLAYAKALLEEPEMLDWINHYHPVAGGAQDFVSDPEFEMQSGEVIWAADVWYSIKKHRVVELQRLIRSRTESSS